MLVFSNIFKVLFQSSRFIYWTVFICSPLLEFVDCNFCQIICCLYVLTVIAFYHQKEKKKTLWPLLSPWLFHLLKLQLEELKPANPFHHIHWELCKCCLPTVQQAEWLAGWFLFARVSCVISEDMYLLAYNAVDSDQILMWLMKLYFSTKLDIDVLSIFLEVCFIP